MLRSLTLAAFLCTSAALATETDLVIDADCSAQIPKGDPTHTQGKVIGWKTQALTPGRAVLLHPRFQSDPTYYTLSLLRVSESSTSAIYRVVLSRVIDFEEFDRSEQSVSYKFEGPTAAALGAVMLKGGRLTSSYYNREAGKFVYVEGKLPDRLSLSYVRKDHRGDGVFGFIRRPKQRITVDCALKLKPVLGDS